MQLEKRIMEVIAIDTMSVIIGLVIGLVIGVAAITAFYQLGFSKKKKSIDEARDNAEIEAQKELAQAQKTGENRKRELLLQAKEEIHKTRLEIDREIKEKKVELQKDRNRLEQKEENLDRKLEVLDQKENALESRVSDVLAMEEKAREIEKQKIFELERISGLTVEEAKDFVLDEARQEYSHDMAVMLKQMEEDTKEKADQKAKEIIVNSIQRFSADYVCENTVSVVALPNEEMKGRIIGREGRNIRAIETITGVDLIIDDTPEAVILSGFDPIRREVARIALEKLILDGRIHPARIEEMVEKAKKEVENQIRESGEQASFDVGIHGLHPELIKLLGRLKYRTSYGQNVLNHSMEVAHLSGLMAAELGADITLAKRAGLLHDIGKAVDHEVEGPHIQIGGDLAKKYRENNDVINAIMAHHGDIEANTIEAILVQSADAISAARPGARRETLENYIKRLEKLEDIANSFPGVDKSFAIQAGREIRIIVKPEDVDDIGTILMSKEIVKRIEKELDYPGQIKVNVIRETRSIEFAK